LGLSHNGAILSSSDFILLYIVFYKNILKKWKF